MQPKIIQSITLMPIMLLTISILMIVLLLLLLLLIFFFFFFLLLLSLLLVLIIKRHPLLPRRQDLHPLRLRRGVLRHGQRPRPGEGRHVGRAGLAPDPGREVREGRQALGHRLKRLLGPTGCLVSLLQAVLGFVLEA